VPTPMGTSRWSKSHVDRVLHTRWVQEIIQDLEAATESLSLPHGPLSLRAPRSTV
jgi:hypothetical protein